jgi:hypothetical protein
MDYQRARLIVGAAICRLNQRPVFIYKFAAHRRIIDKFQKLEYSFNTVLKVFSKNLTSAGSVENEEVVLNGVVFGVRVVSFFGGGRGRKDWRVDADSELAALEPGWGEHESAARSGGV